MFEVHDQIVLGSRKWVVTSVCLGALHQENVIGLRPLDKKPSFDEAMVPEDMLLALVTSEGDLLR